MSTKVYVGMQKRGLIALPAEMRSRLHLDLPGAQVEIVERDDGVIELHPALPVSADQAWFWKEEWQQRERELDRLVQKGQTVLHQNAEDFFSHLAALDESD